jgi:hypothetical protein
LPNPQEHRKYAAGKVTAVVTAGVFGYTILVDPEKGARALWAPVAPEQARTIAVSTAAATPFIKAL